MAMSQTSTPKSKKVSPAFLQMSILSILLFSTCLLHAQVIPLSCDVQSTQPTCFKKNNGKIAIAATGGMTGQSSTARIYYNCQQAIPIKLTEGRNISSLIFGQSSFDGTETNGTAVDVSIELFSQTDQTWVTVFSGNTSNGDIHFSDSVFNFPIIPVVSAIRFNANGNSGCVFNISNMPLTLQSIPVYYSIDGGVNFSEKSIFTGLSAGVYSVVVKDAANTMTSPIEVIFTKPAPVSVDAGPDVTIAPGASTQLHAVGSNGTDPSIVSTYSICLFDAGGGDCKWSDNICNDQSVQFTGTKVSDPINIQGVSNIKGIKVFIYWSCGTGNWDLYLNDQLLRNIETSPDSLCGCSVNAQSSYPSRFSLSGNFLNNYWNFNGDNRLKLVNNTDGQVKVAGYYAEIIYETGVSISWYPYSTLSSRYSDSPIATPDEPTTYEVYYTTPGGCTVVDDVTVNWGEITDTIAPQIDCPANRVMNLNSANCSAVVTYSVSVTDDQDSVVTVTYDPPSGSVFSKGISTVTVTATDMAGNLSFCTFKIELLPAPLAGTLTAVKHASGDEITCYKGNDGMVTANVTGGCMPYSYVWSTIPVQTGSIASGLKAGSYSVVVTEADGASIKLTVKLNQPSYPLSVVAKAGSGTSTCSHDDNDDNTIYLGYGEQSVTLSSSIKGGVPAYCYKWSPAASMSNDVSAAPKVSPMVSTTYQLVVKDINGCSAMDKVTVNVVDVRCGKEGNKVAICHKEKNGNKTKKESLCVSENAVKAHLSHGDYLGECGTGKRDEEDDMITVVTATNFNMTAFPNPFKDHTMIIFSVEQDAYTTIELYDLSGKLVQRLFNAEAQAGMQYAINVDGSEWNSGVYLCRITSNNQIEHVRLVLAR